MSHMKELVMIMEDAWFLAVMRGNREALRDHQNRIRSTAAQKAEVVADIQHVLNVSDKQWSAIRGDLMQAFNEAYMVARAQLRMLGS